MSERHMIKAIVAYDGTDYQGFQRQTRYGVGIQQILEKALSTALHEPILIKAAGRTDAGVHALGQVISFETSSPIPPENYRRAVAHLLPKDIALREAEVVPDEFHARFDAVDKTYRYEVDYSPLPDPCAQRFAWLVREKISLDAMNEAAALLVGTHDFSSFQNHGSQETSPVRTMYEAHWTQEGNRYFFTIRGDGFLYRMVRNIVGCLVKVGTGKWTKDDFAAVMAAHDRKKAGMAAPACGLFLMHVSYK
ncbi:MAG: tRNA pseudouridine(38-40) synthase TruA [Acidaminococcus sp.]|nr:tRNA pseudouridine(38-40) synthase TruA [Acidaminococcus sp.]MCI2100819.1 tRNA pseudouridine(38-40) synthase TruA [Acidaminococcus sp.]MCI2115182.1 tRNA pseudouridine(38-40) synthase TruA [Acidaminococcus sp.]MCI2117257.1 tRNA pseudouridine(38-40) synthase TruA [Acidaminococcus sp.]